MKKGYKYSLFAILALLIIVLGILFSPVGKRYTEKLLGNAMVQLVTQATGPEVIFSYGDITFNIFRGRLRIDEISMIVPVNSAFNQTLDTATIASIDLEVAQLWRVYFSRSLQVRGLSIDKPRIGINLSTNPEKKQEKKLVTMHTGDIYNYISNTLTKLNVGNFQLKSGHFIFKYLDQGTPQKQVLNDISIRIENFDLSEETQDDDKGIFFTENIDIRIRNQKSILPDSVHTANFDSLIISTRDQLFQVYGFSIKPDLVEDPGEVNTIDINFRLLDFEGADFEKAYQEQIIDIKSIIVDGASISLNNKRRRKNNAAKDKPGLIAQITSLFGAIKIGTFGVNNSTLEMNTYPKRGYQREYIEDIDIRVHGIELDTTNAELNLRNQYFSDLDVIIENYDIDLKEANQKVSFGKITISSSSNLIKADNITMLPIDSNRAAGGYNYATLDQIIVTEFDPFTVFSERKAEVGDIILNNLTFKHLPSTIVKEPVEEVNDNTKVSLENLYPAISNLLDKLSIRNIDLRNINLSILDPQTRQPTLNVSNGGLKVSQFLLDSTSYLNDSHFLNADNISVTLPLISITAQDKKILIEDFEILRDEELISAKRIKIDTLYRTDNSQFEAEIDNFYFSGANLRDMLYHQRYDFDTLFFVNPRIKFYSRTDPSEVSKTGNKTVKDILSVFDLDLLGFENANLDFYLDDKLSGVIHEFSFGLVNTTFDPDSLKNDRILARYDDFYINFDSLDWYLPTVSHELKLNDFNMSLKDSTATLGLVRLKPTHDSTEAVYDIKIPSASAQGIFAHQQTFNRNLDFRKISFEEPTVFIRPGKKEGSFEKATENEGIAFDNSPLRLVWDTVQVAQFEVNNANIEAQLNDSTHLNISKLDLAIQNFDASKGQSMLADKFLYSEDITTQLANVQFRQGKSRVDVRSISLSTGEETISFDSIAVIMEGKTSLQGMVGSLDITKFSGYDLLVNGTISLGDVIIDSAHLSLPLKKSNSPKSSTADAPPAPLPERFAQLTSYPLSKSSINQINADRFKLKNASIDLIKEDTTTLGTFYFGLENILLDSTSIATLDRPFHADRFYFGLENFHYVLSPFMTAQIATADFNSADSLFTMRKLRIIPSYRKRDFGIAFGKQTDWLDLSLGRLRLEKFDIPSIITQKAILASTLTLDSLNLSLFRDKNVPFPEDQVRYLPQKYLDDLPYDLKLDTMLVNDLNVKYEELPEDGNIAGRITFDNIAARVYHITNVADFAPADSMMRVTATGLLMSSGNLSAILNFNLLDPAYSWNLKASLGPMDLTRLNPMLVNAASARIRRGSTSRLEEIIYADDTYAKGRMKFYYKNLAVELLNPDHVYEKKGLGKAITTFFANAFVVKSRNPRPLLKQGEIFFIRDPQRSVFNYLSKATLSGVITSVGARSNQRAIRDQNKEDAMLAEEERKKRKKQEKKKRKKSK